LDKTHKRGKTNDRKWQEIDKTEQKQAKIVWGRITDDEIEND